MVFQFRQKRSLVLGVKTLRVVIRSPNFKPKPSNPKRPAQIMLLILWPTSIRSCCQHYLINRPQSLRARLELRCHHSLHWPSGEPFASLHGRSIRLATTPFMANYNYGAGDEESAELRSLNAEVVSGSISTSSLSL